MWESNAQRKIARRRRRTFGVPHMGDQLFHRVAGLIRLNSYFSTARRNGIRARSQHFGIRNLIRYDAEAPGDPGWRCQAIERRVMQ